MTRGFPIFMPEDKAPSLKLNKEELSEMAAINSEGEILVQKRLILVRSAAKRQDLIAERLKDLKSQTGGKFIAQKRKERPYKEIRTAIVRENSIIVDNAYFCMGCNWVLGVPRTEDYDNIGFLSGSAGVNFYCKICGMKIGRFVTIRS
jgi:hypothetical protein